MCRIAVCEGLPPEMRADTREIVALVSANPRKGYGRRLMVEVCREADEAGKVLIVQPGQFAEGMTTDQLERWYQGFGFVALPKEGSAPTVMARARYGMEVSA